MPRATPGRRVPDPSHVQQARRLITACGGSVGDAASVADAVGTACARILDHLGPLIGRRAAAALLARSVYLSKREFQLLHGVATGEAQAEVVRELPLCLRAAQPEEALEAAISVLGMFVSILAEFISENLALRLLREACPDPDEEQP